MYVSCNPSTLARDLAHFARLGYRAESLTPFDMMPLTDHVETVARLVRAEPVAPRLLFEQGALVATNKAPHEPVEGAPEPALSQRLRRVPGCEGAVPLSQLPEEMSGVCLFAREAEAAATLRAVADVAEAVLLVLAKGVMHKRGRLERPVPGPTGSHKLSARYTRLSVEGGHSLIKLELPVTSLFAVGKLLASVGHPVLGSPQTARGTLLHFKMRHGLSRPFVHCRELRFSLAGTAHSVGAELPGDLARVLESLRAGRSTRAPEAD